jgi:hypothetical protein
VKTKPPEPMQVAVRHLTGKMQLALIQRRPGTAFLDRSGKKLAPGREAH